MKLKTFWILIALCFPNLSFAQAGNGSANFWGTAEEYSKLQGGNYLVGEKPIPFVKGTVPELRGKSYYSDYFKEGNPELKDIKVTVRSIKSLTITRNGRIYFQSVRPGTPVKGPIEIYVDIFIVEKKNEKKIKDALIHS